LVGPIICLASHYFYLKRKKEYSKLRTEIIQLTDKLREENVQRRKELAELKVKDEF
jgi:hypothetical protein